MKAIVALIVTLIILGFTVQTIKTNQIINRVQTEYHYIPLGDSYTIGERVDASESWPSQLSEKLKSEKIKIILIKNLAQSGFATADVIKYELPEFAKSDANFTTILIGTNDIITGVEKDEFQKNITIILDTVQEKIPNKTKIILLTTPNFTVTPTGKKFLKSDTLERLAVFNQIIINEGKNRGLPVVDLFGISNEMEGNYDLMARDWLHPSAKEYENWNKLIFPVALKLLKD